MTAGITRSHLQLAIPAYAPPVPSRINCGQAERTAHLWATATQQPNERNSEKHRCDSSGRLGSPIESMMATWVEDGSYTGAANRSVMDKSIDTSVSVLERIIYAHSLYRG